MSDGRRYRFNSLRISNIGFKFGGIIYSIKNKIPIQNGRDRHFCSFHIIVQFCIISLGQSCGILLTHNYSRVSEIQVIRKMEHFAVVDVA